MSRRSGERGVTLMELLVAVTLVSLISTGLLMSLRIGLNAMEKTNTRLYGNRRMVSLQRSIEQQISGVMPVQAFCPGEGGAMSPVPFFRGDESSMRFATAFSLSEGWRGFPRIVELMVVPREGGGVRLVANEHLYAGPHSTGSFCIGGRFLPVQAGPQSVVIADRLQFCRFVYREGIPGTLRSIWIPAWTKVDLPIGVRIELAPMEIDPAGIPMQSITVPIRVTRQVMEKYADRQ